MMCGRCGQAIPGGSQFCLKCGAPVTPVNPTVVPSSIESRRMTGATGRAAGPGRTIIVVLALLAIVLAAAVGSVIHGRLANASGPQGTGGPLASATAPGALPASGMANAPEHPYTSGGMANATAPQQSGSGMANAVAPQARAGGMANATAIPLPAVSMANTRSGPGPQNAQVQENIMPYLQALARIEGERQQLDGEADAGLSNLQQAGAKAMIALADPDGDRAIGQMLSQAMAFIPNLVSHYIRLRGEIEILRQSPGVPASCEALQRDYAAAIDPWVKMGVPAIAQQDRVVQQSQRNPMTGATDTSSQLQNAMGGMIVANQQSASRLDAAEADLSMVCQSHRVTAPPPFPIKNTMKQGGGMASAISSP